MDNDKPQSPVPICAHLSGIAIVGDLKGKSSTTRPDHYVVVYLSDQEVARSEKKLRLPTSQWKWPEDQQFWIHPSSTLKIVIYRESKVRITKHLVGQYIGKVVELLENNATMDLKDKSGARIASKLRIDLSLISEPDEGFMDTVIANVTRLESTLRAPTGISALGAALQLTKNIMDVVAGTHSILNASWTVLSAAYKAVQQIELLDDTVRDLAENLLEMLGVAKEYPGLLVVSGTTNVIEEIGRTSLNVASLIYEYTRPSFTGRILKSQISDDMTSRIAQCLKSCKDLKEKFDRRVGMDTNRATKEIKGDIAENKLNQLVEKIDKWLGAPDSSRNYNEARTKHHKDTGSWFFDGPRFRELQETAGFLWIMGTAGCGKTILSSCVIDKIIQLQKENASVTYAYFFFDGRDSQKDLQLHDKLIRSLIWQLSLQCDGLPTALVQLYGRGHQQPSTSSLEDTLHRIIDGLHSTYIIIDSLDECTDRKQTLQWINRIISIQRCNLRLVVASRPESDIDPVLQKLDPHCVDLVNESANHDITTYLEQELQLVTDWNEDTRELVKSKLIKGAQGMFRWVALQLIDLQNCSSPQSVESQLDHLPDSLSKTYDRILLKIDNETDRTDTKTFLRWLCFSVRPMKLAEIAETVVVDFNVENEPQYTPRRRYFNKRDVMKKCAGLIAESADGNVKLAHFSIKEYLFSKHLLVGVASRFHLASDEISHSWIAQTCLSYLLHLDKLDLVDENVAVSFPLARYAAQHWIFHAQSGGIDKLEPSFTLTLAKKLFAPKGDAWFNWVRIWNLDNPNVSVMKYQHQLGFGAPLYYAVLAGLEQVSLQLMEDSNVNVQGGKYGTVLQAALAKGHEGIVKLLLAKGADVNAQGGYYGNALQAASAERYEGVVKQLLENGAHVNVQGGHHGNALQAASAEGQEGIAKLLLENGANVNAPGGYYSSALYAASAGGYKEIVRLLLESGADVNAQGEQESNALYPAAARGYKEIVKLLLDKGTNVNAQGGEDGNALQAASARGHDGIVKLLLENGADVNAQGGYSGNALQAASAFRHEEIVKLLLENGADVNAQGGYYSNAVYAASTGGYEGIVNLLLQKSADVNAQGGHYGNALQAASAEGHQRIVKVLLEKGAQVNARGGHYSNALYAASARGHEGIVELLLEKGADVEAQGGEYGSALQVASARGFEGIVKLLVEKGADVNIQGQEGKYSNALQAASTEGYKGIVKLLLDNGAHISPLS